MHLYRLEADGVAIDRHKKFNPWVAHHLIELDTSWLCFHDSPRTHSVEVSALVM